MTAIEQYLKNYWFATRNIGRLMLDLNAAKHAYEESYGSVPISKYHELRVKQRKNISPTELAYLIEVNQYSAEVESIETRLREERATIAVIECTVRKAKLAPREEEYVRLRYYENQPAHLVARKMYCSESTAALIRNRALEKVKTVMKY
jgi:DNA-directed RNA polymerase specialized sigma24 family protein